MTRYTSVCFATHKLNNQNNIRLNWIFFNVGWNLVGMIYHLLFRLEHIPCYYIFYCIKRHISKATFPKTCAIKTNYILFINVSKVCQGILWMEEIIQWGICIRLLAIFNAKISVHTLYRGEDCKRPYKRNAIKTKILLWSMVNSSNRSIRLCV